MGTRAAFWVGDPADLENREWLGCVAWDGHPESFKHLARIRRRDTFKKAILAVAASRGDFASPTAGGWPFPWDDDVFLTDVTYALIDGVVQVCWFHQPFKALADYLKIEDADAEDETKDDPRHANVPAPKAYDPQQPDSIIMLISPHHHAATS